MSTNLSNTQDDILRYLQGFNFKIYGNNNGSIGNFAHDTSLYYRFPLVLSFYPGDEPIEFSEVSYEVAVTPEEFFG
jgi:hypothetical protein